MKINEKIRYLRETRRLSQEVMAEKLGMSVTGYAKIERGEVRSNLPRLEQISEVFDMDICELLSYGDEGQIYFHNAENGFSNSNNFLTVGHNNSNSQEIERLQQLLAHKEELMAQKDKLIESLERELALLRKLTSGQS
ncbi:DNA-binding XRE family transcriptional regulator [Nicoletella semolina]|uniref:DNA-binding XRE family transcriptional regulator n=1 Tax=Nicoletella semolina TaxID=271160 RepID=A0A4R2N9E1_9PAST|nr:helix-turn-helix transcriptional regulator [Nicoletella semolina]MDH2923786.1 DNA-binding protein [Nicoletella semolina]MDH2925558.1 DNA-binding protein [Nicoletella semolina]TCP17622.1 DNA-binding XRE family transcriptional regulator [Nicoletella semolina]